MDSKDVTPSDSNAVGKKLSAKVSNAIDWCKYSHLPESTLLMSERSQ